MNGSVSSMEARNLSYQINSKTIISNLNIKINKGELVGIIGPNGAGKSTFLKLLTNILKPTSGYVFLNDRNISEFSPKDLNKKLAYLPQNVSFNFPFKVSEIVLMGRYPYLGRLQNESSIDNKLAADSLRFVDMQDFKERNILTLSGGEQQRVSLARVITQQTDFLFLDEPISNLDIHHQLSIMNLLKSLSGEGKGVYTVLHDIKLANKFCDKLIVLDQGEIITEGNPNIILDESLISKVFNVKTQISYDNSGKKIINFLEPTNGYGH
ncbi:MAG: heme ABC transporter ATP-binding protein [Candidatus Dadabacteria bacterium]|nr:heme ABC transporter ATP-binding protein [Candidatus Dadabacteria bacterium]NIQ15556.1 heme ABC transporter ATP-binding protein [Candidatus Dadabacteria bacterium]